MKNMVSIFLDLEKAHDTTWKYGNMKDLYYMNLRGSLPLFIQNLLPVIFMTMKWEGIRWVQGVRFYIPFNSLCDILIR